MKATALFVFIMALCLLVIPMIAIESGKEPAKSGGVPVHSPAASVLEAKPVPEEIAVEEYVDGYAPEEPEPGGAVEADSPSVSAVPGVSSFLILDESTGNVNEVSVKDYIRGAVAAEMPASFHAEALKAQAVAAHTFALHNHIVQEKSPDPALKGADFTADPGNMKVYITEATARDFYGEDADFYWNKICKAADSVADYILEYGDEPIVAAYHAISSGITEDAANIWSGSAPYLLAVSSEGDQLAPGFESTVTLTSAEVQEKLVAAYPDMQLGADPAAWFGEPERSQSGYVTLIEVGGEELHGKDIRRVFELRSHNFDVGYSGGDFVFTVTGYGHGVGLSQYGADFLARQGMSFDEILGTYYTGTMLKTAAAS